MVKTDTLEGIIDNALHFRYDLFTDVLNLRLLFDMETPSLGEENDDGFIELRDERTSRLVGLTTVSWWKRFGHGSLPDSISEIQKQIEPLAKRVAA